MFLVVIVVSLVPPSILPCVNTISMHHAVLELANEGTAISPLESALTRHFIGKPVTFIARPVDPIVNAVSVLYTLTETADVVAAIRPYFDT